MVFVSGSPLCGGCLWGDLCGGMLVPVHCAWYGGVGAAPVTIAARVSHMWDNAAPPVWLVGVSLLHPMPDKTSIEVCAG